MIMDEESKMFETFGRWAHAAILAEADESSFREKADELTQKLSELKAPFKKDQIVFVLESASILKAEIKALEYVSVMQNFRYLLFERTGRRLGWFDQTELFASKEDLIQFYTNILK